MWGHAPFATAQQVPSRNVLQKRAVNELVGLHWQVSELTEIVLSVLVCLDVFPVKLVSSTTNTSTTRLVRHDCRTSFGLSLASGMRTRLCRCGRCLASCLHSNTYRTPIRRYLPVQSALSFEFKGQRKTEEVCNANRTMSGLPRMVIKWLQSLDLTHPIKNVRRYEILGYQCVQCVSFADNFWSLGTFQMGIW